QQDTKSARDRFACRHLWGEENCQRSKANQHQADKRVIDKEKTPNETRQTDQVAPEIDCFRHRKACANQAEMKNSRNLECFREYGAVHSEPFRWNPTL